METKVRYRAVRRADRVNDQRTPVEILNALASSVSQEDLQEFLLSQIKQIIFGSSPGTWNDDFGAAAILSLLELTQRSDSGAALLNVTCTSTSAVGDLICPSGVTVEPNLVDVTRVDPTNPLRMPCLGILLSKSDATHGVVRTSGIVPGLGTLVPGKAYFVGLDGRVSLSRPFQSRSFVQQVGIALDPDRLLLNTLGVTRLA